MKCLALLCLVLSLQLASAITLCSTTSTIPLSLSGIGVNSVTVTHNLESSQIEINWLTSTSTDFNVNVQASADTNDELDLISATLDTGSTADSVVLNVQYNPNNAESFGTKNVPLAALIILCISFFFTKNRLGFASFLVAVVVALFPIVYGATCIAIKADVEVPPNVKQLCVQSTCQCNDGWTGDNCDTPVSLSTGTTANPTTANPTTRNPTTASPTTANPTTANPTTANPTTANPTTANPTTANPTTASPTTADPTTANPTTANPTTQDPTTANPTTQDPTTANPTTQDPTTADPTTADPTTANPTTQDPTTQDPTTQDPTTQDPTTQDPTTATTQDPTTQDPTTGTTGTTGSTGSTGSTGTTGTTGAMVQVIDDPSFELDPASSSWTYFDAAFGSPRCNNITCAPYAYDGDWYVWNGGGVDTISFVHQTVTIQGGDAYLSFYLIILPGGTYGELAYFFVVFDWDQVPVLLNETAGQEFLKNETLVHFTNLDSLNGTAYSTYTHIQVDIPEEIKDGQPHEFWMVGSATTAANGFKWDLVEIFSFPGRTTG